MPIIQFLWSLFASVRLAIITLAGIAVTSILGTVIPQGKHFDWYVHYYSSIKLPFTEPLGETIGYKLAVLGNMLSIPDMYSASWFIFLLLLLTINLIVCSIERFPTAYKQVNIDNLAYNQDRLENMQNKKTVSVNKIPASFSDTITALLHKNRFTVKKSSDDTQIYSADKGKYSRYGVYIVHLSIIVIFFGAFIGSQFGFKASVMIPELRETDVVYSQRDSSPIELGFTVACESFNLDYYDNGMISEYRSLLTVKENGKKILQKSIEVNKPLKFRGLTFYQANYEPFQDFVITFKNQTNNTAARIATPYLKENNYEAAGITYGIINGKGLGNRITHAKLWIKSEDTEPQTAWLEVDKDNEIQLGDTRYVIHAKQMYATGLQVAKDPGVWVVYFGFAALLVGLYMSFFIQHQRIWILCTKENEIKIYGTSNKNRMAFKKIFDEIGNKLENTLK